MHVQRLCGLASICPDDVQHLAYSTDHPQAYWRVCRQHQAMDYCRERRNLRSLIGCVLKTGNSIPLVWHLVVFQVPIPAHVRNMCIRSFQAATLELHGQFNSISIHFLARATRQRLRRKGCGCFNARVGHSTSEPKR